MNELRKAVVSVLGNDQKGIIAKVTNILYEYDVNIMDISQTIISGLFSMVMVVDVSSEHCNFDGVSQELHKLGESLGNTIRGFKEGLAGDDENKDNGKTEA